MRGMWEGNLREEAMPTSFKAEISRIKQRVSAEEEQGSRDEI